MNKILTSNHPTFWGYKILTTNKHTTMPKQLFVVQIEGTSLYSRTDGGAGTSLYVKESGTGNTGWVAK